MITKKEAWAKDLSHFTAYLGLCIPKDELTDAGGGEVNTKVIGGVTVIDYIRWNTGGGWDVGTSKTFGFTLSTCRSVTTIDYDVKWGDPYGRALSRIILAG